MMPIRLGFTRFEFPQFVDLMGYKVAAEIGVNLGEFSYHLLKNSKLERLWCVDSYEGKYRQARRGAFSYLSNFPGRHSFYQESSIHCAMRWAKDSPLDFVYIDANHQKEQVAADIAAWAPLVRSGGVLAGHDYVGRWSGVIEAVDEYAAHMGWQLFLTKEAWASWLFFVP